MRYRAVSFDAAGTLVRVRWDPSQIAVEAAQAAGLPISDRAAAQKTYESILRDRWHVFVRLNLQRSQEVCDRFWLDMSHDWLAAIGADVARAQELYDIAQAQVFGQDTGVFSLYPDTLPALEALKSAGIPMIVVSNWDVSLHRVLRLLGLTGHFRTVVASLEEGVEKPDPKLFDIAVSRLDIDRGRSNRRRPRRTRGRTRGPPPR